MISKDILRQIVEYQSTQKTKLGIIAREKRLNLDTQQIVIITGIRRCGKSTFLKLIKKKDFAYINLEDPRLNDFALNDFYKLEEIFKERKEDKAFFFDEIQNISDWEKYIRAAHEQGTQILITGSNASMLSRELGTKLTGRYKQIELFPFSYSEFLKYKNYKRGLQSFEEYLLKGGFPGYLYEEDEEYLQLVLKDVLMKDIVIRYEIKNENVLERLALYLLSNVGKEFSYNRLAKTLEIKSVRTVIDYIDYMMNSYLFDTIHLFTYSIHKQIKNPKKIYAIDTGLIKANTLSFSKDDGRILENAVFLHLRRKYKKIFYFREKNECDFIISIKNKPTLAVQVCHKLTEENLKREVEGLKEAMKKCKIAKGFIVTYNQDDNFDNIEVIPGWKFFYMVQ